MAKRLALVIQASVTQDETSEPWIWAHVQVWQGREHLGNVDMGPHHHPFVKPELPDSAPLEQWAAQLGRIAARILEDNFHEAIRDNDLHHVTDFDIVGADK